MATLRGLLRLRVGDAALRPPVPLDEVEPVEAIVKRFATGAMSYGSISAEAHETLAIAMNRLGGPLEHRGGGRGPQALRAGRERRPAPQRRQTGGLGPLRGHERVPRERRRPTDQDRPGRQTRGGRPAPGSQGLPLDSQDALLDPGVGLISPPPHHDIYSIEDLAQLIYDLKNANPAARIHVKLVAEVGVGTVAAGVAKAHADVVLISGHDGGTGAAPLTSLKHSGAPWELGLAETQQTLLRNGLRDRITVQVDGQLKTGRDVIVAALLGAEEFGFATAPLVVSGCVMMRVCHLDTCPVGIATQNPELRRHFAGRPEFIETFFQYIAEECRELLAALGFRTMAEAVGHVESLDTAAAIDHYWKAGKLDLGPILEPVTYHSTALHHPRPGPGLDTALDRELIVACGAAISEGKPVTFARPIRNIHRAVGTMLGSEVTGATGAQGCRTGPYPSVSWARPVRASAPSCPAASR